MSFLKAVRCSSRDCTLNGIGVFSNIPGNSRDRVAEKSSGQRLIPGPRALIGYGGCYTGMCDSMSPYDVNLSGLEVFFKSAVYAPMRQ